MLVMGDMSLGGTIIQVTNLAETLQVAFDAGAKKNSVANVECSRHSCGAR
jgi:predicted ATP-dependent Lon-type protease